jgi:hypothetical protein
VFLQLVGSGPRGRETSPLVFQSLGDFQAGLGGSPLPVRLPPWAHWSPKAFQPCLKVFHGAIHYLVDKRPMFI